MKASDLSDTDVLGAVEQACVRKGYWANTSEIADVFPAAPFKVVAAKLGQLLKRDLLTGCNCGCRGDWELTTAGRVLAGIEGEWRKNPQR